MSSQILSFSLCLLLSFFAWTCEATAPVLSSVKKGSTMTCKKPSSGASKFMQCGIDFDLEVNGNTDTFVRVKYVDAGATAPSSKADFGLSASHVQAFGPVVNDAVVPYGTSGTKTGNVVYIADGGEKEYDIYVVAVTETGNTIAEMSTVSKVDFCKCPTPTPTPPALSSVKKGSTMTCKKPSSGGSKFMQCGIDFDLEVNGNTATFVRVKYVDAGATAPSSKADFGLSASHVQAFGPVVNDAVVPYGTSGTKTGNVVYIADGGEKEYDIYVVAVTETGNTIAEMSNVSKVDFCDCPGPSALASVDDDDDAPFPDWAIAIIVLVVLLLIGICGYVEKKRPCKKIATDANTQGKADNADNAASGNAA